MLAFEKLGPSDYVAWHRGIAWLLRGKDGRFTACRMRKGEKAWARLDGQPANGFSTAIDAGRFCQTLAKLKRAGVAGKGMV